VLTFDLPIGVLGPVWGPLLNSLDPNFTPNPHRGEPLVRLI